MRILGFEIKRYKNPEPKIGSMFIPHYYQGGKPIPQMASPYEQVSKYASWVYACVSRNANYVAAAPLKLYVVRKTRNQKMLVKTRPVSKSKMLELENRASVQDYVRKALAVEEVVEHPFIDLMKNVNRHYNQHDLINLTQTFLELTGNAYWWVVKDNVLDIPMEIWVLPSQNMRVVSGKGTFVKGYVYTVGTEQIPFLEDEIIHHKFINPQNQIYGFSPLQAASSPVGKLGEIDRFEYSLLKNNARPEGVLTTDQSLTEQEFNRIKKTWQENYGSIGNKGRTVLLEKGINYTPISFSPKDLGFDTTKKWSREEIATIFGVPMSKISPENVNLANAKAGERQYVKDTIEPRLRRLEEKINERLLPLYDSQLFASYDAPLPEDKEFELKKMETFLQNALTTVNEERDRLGMKPVDWGDIPIINQANQPLGLQPDKAPLVPTEEQVRDFVEKVEGVLREKIRKQRGKKEEGEKWDS